MSKKEKRYNPNIAKKVSYKAVSCCWNCNSRFLSYDKSGTFKEHKCEKVDVNVKFDYVCSEWSVKED